MGYFCCGSIIILLGVSICGEIFVNAGMLHAYFSKFGTFSECCIMRDSLDRSRGFGFITFGTLFYPKARNLLWMKTLRDSHSHTGLVFRPWGYHPCLTEAPRRQCRLRWVHAHTFFGAVFCPCPSVSRIFDCFVFFLHHNFFL
jgi:hypothetical protein